MGPLIVAFVLAGAVLFVGIGAMVFFWGVEHDDDVTLGARSLDPGQENPVERA